MLIGSQHERKKSARLLNQATAVVRSPNPYSRQAGGVPISVPPWVLFLEELLSEVRVTDGLVVSSLWLAHAQMATHAARELGDARPGNQERGHVEQVQEHLVPVTQCRAKVLVA